MVIEEPEHGSSSYLEGRKRKGASSFRRQNKVEETLPTVAPITQQQQGSIIQQRKNAGYCRLYFNNGHQTEEWPNVLMLVRLSLHQQSENNMGNISYERNMSPLRERTYHGGPNNQACRSSIKPTVSRGVNNSCTVYQAGSSSSRPTQKS